MTIHNVIGDCLNDAPCLKRKIIAHICNDCGGWGSGFVVNLSKVYPQAEEAYRKWHTFESYKIGETSIPFALGNIQVVPVDKSFVCVINMIAQHNTISTDPGSKPIRYAALASCMTKTANICRKLNGEFHIPRIGSVLAGGRWDFIEELINEIWGEFDVYIYTLPS